MELSGKVGNQPYYQVAELGFLAIALRKSFLYFIFVNAVCYVSGENGLAPVEMTLPLGLDEPKLNETQEQRDI